MKAHNKYKNIIVFYSHVLKSNKQETNRSVLNPDMIQLYQKQTLINRNADYLKVQFVRLWMIYFRN